MTGGGSEMTGSGTINETHDPTALRALGQQAQLVRINRATAELVSALANQGIRSMLLKGPTTGRVLYLGEERSYTDIDLLVEPSAMDRAEATAIRLGYRRREEPTHLAARWAWRKLETEERTLDRSIDGVALDLHRSFHQFPVNFKLLAELWSTRDEIIFAGVSIPTPSVSCVGLLTLLHAAESRHPRARRERLVADVERAIDRLGLEVWEEIGAVSKRLGVAEDVVAVLREIGGESGRQLADTALKSVKPDRWISAHLRTGSIVALHVKKIGTYSWPQRVLWCVVALVPRLRPTASLREQSTASNESAWLWLAKDVLGLVRVALWPRQRREKKLH
jgi:Uncharacterised nucleotidyltransferase